MDRKQYHDMEHNKRKAMRDAEEWARAAPLEVYFDADTLTEEDIECGNSFWADARSMLIMKGTNVPELVLDAESRFTGACRDCAVDALVERARQEVGHIIMDMRTGKDRAGRKRAAGEQGAKMLHIPIMKAEEPPGG